MYMLYFKSSYGVVVTVTCTLHISCHSVYGTRVCVCNPLMQMGCTIPRLANVQGTHRALGLQGTSSASFIAVDEQNTSSQATL